MPELPEVETTVQGLQKVLNRTFVNVWTNTPKLIKKPSSLALFRKGIKGKKIKKIYRRGKNIIFDLSDDYSLLIHQKMTGHLLYDKWDENDRYNSYIHLKFTLDNGKILALSDLRKFAKVELQKTRSLLKELSSLGPEPLEISFEEFKSLFKKRRGKIKKVLMNQNIIVGIGNIYADEILWETKIHPFKDVSEITEKEFKKIYTATRIILKKALKLGGTSISDYRDIYGRKGSFGDIRKAYRREGEKCFRCGATIKRKKIGARSTCFCPECQII